MVDLADVFKTVVSLFVIVDPIGNIPLFLTVTEKWAPERRARASRLASVTVFVVLSIAALLGDKILKLFGISLASFSVGSGILLMMLAISMLQARISSVRQTPEEAEEAADWDAIGAVPLGVPLLAGPGAISNVMVSIHQHPGVLDLFLIFIPIGIVSASVWVSFTFATPIVRRFGNTGIHIVTRLMGLVLAALAVELMARGLATLFPILGR
jgi:multiple antibiotic resistance protein